MYLTKINGDELHFADALDELLVLVLFDSFCARIFLNLEPLQDALFILQVPSVNDWFKIAVSEENDRGNSEHAHLSSEVFIVNFDEINAGSVGIVINMFELFQNFFALFAIFVTVFRCQKSRDRWILHKILHDD